MSRNLHGCGRIDTRVDEVANGGVEHEGASISRAEFESNLLEKLADPVFTEDMSPLLVLGEHPSPALHPQNAGRTVMDKLIALIPGEAWKRGN